MIGAAYFADLAYVSSSLGAMDASVSSPSGISSSFAASCPIPMAHHQAGISPGEAAAAAAAAAARSALAAAVVGKPASTADLEQRMDVTVRKGKALCSAGAALRLLWKFEKSAHTPAQQPDQQQYKQQQKGEKGISKHVFKAGAEAQQAPVPLVFAREEIPGRSEDVVAVISFGAKGKGLSHVGPKGLEEVIGAVLKGKNEQQEPWKVVQGFALAA